jgi:hypothetical protein
MWQNWDSGRMWQNNGRWNRKLAGTLGTTSTLAGTAGSSTVQVLQTGRTFLTLLSTRAGGRWVSHEVSIETQAEQQTSSHARWG